MVGERVMSDLDRAVRSGAPVSLDPAVGGLHPHWTDPGAGAAVLGGGVGPVRAARPSWWWHWPWTAKVDGPVTGARVVRQVARLLTAVGPLDTAEVLTRWSRGARLAGYVPLPSREVTALWLAAHPAFTCGPDGLWRCEPVELDATTDVLVRVLRAHPAGLDRAGLRTACVAAGMKPATFAVASSYSPVLAHAGRDLWVLAQHRWADHVAADAAVPSPARRRRPAAATVWTWGADGAVVVSTTLTRTESPVLTIPAGARPFVDNRTFTVTGPGTDAKDVVKVSAGKAWGFHRFLATAAAQVGDTLEVRFSLTGTAQMALIPASQRTGDQR